MHIPYHLQQIAALGTGHALAPEMKLESSFEQLTAKHFSAEGQLLLSVAELSLGRQAGYCPPQFNTEFPEYPHHGKKVISIKATLHLIATIHHFVKTRIFRYYKRQKYLHYSNPHFFYEWCVSFLASDKELPGELLPRLLNIGTHYSDIQTALWFLLGQKGLGLAKQRSDKWEWFLSMERPSFHEIYPASAERDEMLLRLIHERGIPQRIDKVVHMLANSPYRFSSEAAHSVVHFFARTWADVWVEPKQFQVIASNFVIYAPLLCQKEFVELVRERGHSPQFCDKLVEVVHFREEMQRAMCV